MQDLTTNRSYLVNKHVLSLDAWLCFTGFCFAEELKDYDFVVFLLQPDSRTVESELRASVPVSS